ncbi:hypothetical protein DICSQDRAFT_155899 [Dichomitus squalens LYAD-421 SS1]|uniref:Uncharacterized protein n=1 Tax=Dichomitus squalens (strain LYAD-421) TaxID=732165 RepID=R7SVB7_DICSQ|nr:uncharacterized protein DICSQDRAFT_155899 [Dichomitus squalens LYAD-421 SS1]EJF60144.1 hypothetical protein DICSQDRAFT_155899 [Dichomitus squalens LYAD-421 SS1]
MDFWLPSMHDAMTRDHKGAEWELGSERHGRSHLGRPLARTGVHVCGRGVCTYGWPPTATNYHRDASLFRVERGARCPVGLCTYLSTGCVDYARRVLGWGSIRRCTSSFVNHNVRAPATERLRDLRRTYLEREVASSRIRAPDPGPRSISPATA